MTKVNKKTRVADSSCVKQKLRQAKAEIKDLKKIVKKLENQKKELRIVLDSCEQMLRDHTDNISLEDAIKNANKKKSLNAKEKFKSELRKQYGNKDKL